MVSIPGVSPIVMWAGFLILILIFLIMDLGVFNKKKHEISIKEALIWTGVWFGLSMLFNLFVYYEFGSDAALKFFGGYLLEKALSVDNIFVIFLLFASFRIDKIYQHKILVWGIIGAIILGGILIILGTAIVSKFEWVFYIFGVFLIYSAIQMIRKKDEDFDPHDSKLVKLIHKIVPVTRDHKEGKFFVRDNGRFAITIMLVTLIVIEFTDLVFAFDSIPAIFGITTDPFIVFTSNIFAILGLRSLYFVIAKVHDLFHYLSYGLALILTFIGAKMLLMKVIHISVALSLVVVFVLLFVSIAVSILFPQKCKIDKLNEKKKLIMVKKNKK
jgi:tellurite resistance protein TerC